MEVKASDLKVKDKIKLENKIYEIIDIKTSDVGKHGHVKCRIEAKDSSGNKIIRIMVDKDLVEKV